jgi:hypothetical protein
VDIVAFACADAERIINAHGSDATLTESDGTAHEVKAQVYRVDHIVDPATGTEILEPAIEVQISVSGTGLYPDETWQATVTDGLGEETTGQVMATRYDRSRCVVTFWIEAHE